HDPGGSCRFACIILGHSALRGVEPPEHVLDRRGHKGFRRRLPIEERTRLNRSESAPPLKTGEGDRAGECRGEGERHDTARGQGDRCRTSLLALVLWGGRR